MKVKYLSMLEMAVLIIAFPFQLVIYLVFLPFVWVSRFGNWMYSNSKFWTFKFGNWLLRHSYEVKHGLIKNRSVIRNMTAFDVYEKYHL